MHYDRLVDWILENQEGGGNEAPKPSRAKKAATSKKGGGKAALAAKKGGGKAAPKKTSSKRKEPESEPLPGIDPDGEGVAPVDVPGVVNTLIGKIDELGKVVNSNFEELSGKVAEQTDKIEGLEEENFKLQCELYKTQGMLVHMMHWLETARILDPEEAPEGLDTESKLSALAEEVEGNEEGEDE